MSTASRKARKRAGIPLVKPPKIPTTPHGRTKGFGLVSGAEIMAGIVVRGRL